MKLSHRLTTTLGATLALTMIAGPALAHSCVNASKKTGAGSAGDGYFTAYISQEGDILYFDEDYSGEPNAQGRPTGGWFTTHFLAVVGDDDPVEIATFDVNLHRDLPQSARFGGPGDTMCDGIGIDDLDTCLEPMIADFLASL